MLMKSGPGLKGFDCWSTMLMSVVRKRGTGYDNICEGVLEALVSRTVCMLPVTISSKDTLQNSLPCLD